MFILPVITAHGPRRREGNFRSLSTKQYLALSYCALDVPPIQISQTPWDQWNTSILLVKKLGLKGHK